LRKLVKVTPDRFGLGLISALSARGQLHFETFSGSMNSERFIEFLNKLLVDTGGPIIVICDNVRYHKSKAVKQFIKSTKDDITIKYLPPYAPELNPDEQVWNALKAKVSQLFITGKEQLKAEVERVLSGFRDAQDLLLSFFQLECTRYAAHTC
jgi:transposase